MPWLLLLIAIKSVVIFYAVDSSGIGLGPDEAQYWTWSQQLDWGYYSKPPAITWQIRAGTALFGDTELGVRFFSAVISGLTSIALYYLSLAARCRRTTALYAASMLALSPLGILGSFLAITDGGMLLFWTAACIPLVRALQKSQKPNYYLVALAILLGALFKWPIYLLWLAIPFLVWRYPFMRSKHIVGGIFLSLVGLLPSLYWNVTHDFATFKHVLATISGGHGGETGTMPLRKGNLLEFVGAQAALLSPLLFVGVVAAWIGCWRNISKMPPPQSFLGGLSSVIFVCYALASTQQKIQGNWSDFAYPTALAFLAWYSLERRQWGRKLLPTATVLSLLLVIAVIAMPLPQRMNPFKHNVGWQGLSDALTRAGYDPARDFLFSDKYQTVSELSFYGPEQKRAYFFNLQGARRNQFSYWPRMANEEKGRHGFFVAVEKEKVAMGDYEKLNAPYFDRVTAAVTDTLAGKNILILRCEGYNGSEPTPATKF